MTLKDLSALERKTYDFIKKAGEIQPRNMPESRMIGAISDLKTKGLVVVFKRYTSWAHKRKKKFVRVKESEEQELSNNR